MHKHLALTLVVVYITLLTVFSLVNIADIPRLGSTFDDKIYHFIAYAILTFLLYYYFINIPIKRNIVLAAFTAIVYGIFMEFLQYLLTNTRTADIYDVRADVFGIIFGAIICIVYKKVKVKIN
ncbi:MAG: VanZ family protein [Gelidibacter sp.]